jgi:hypothetical protein
MGTGEVHIRFCWGNLREGDDLENPGVNFQKCLPIRCIADFEKKKTDMSRERLLKLLVHLLSDFLPI